MLGDVNASFGTYLVSAQNAHNWRMSVHGPELFEVREPSPESLRIVTPWALLLEVTARYCEFNLMDLQHEQHPIRALKLDLYLESKSQSTRRILPFTTFRELMCL